MSVVERGVKSHWKYVPFIVLSLRLVLVRTEVESQSISLDLGRNTCFLARPQSIDGQIFSVYSSWFISILLDTHSCSIPRTTKDCLSVWFICFPWVELINTDRAT